MDLHITQLKIGKINFQKTVNNVPFQKSMRINIHWELQKRRLNHQNRQNWNILLQFSVAFDCKGIILPVLGVKINPDVRAFCSCTPSVWNNLPLSVPSASSTATFRKCPQTHLFDLVFTPQLSECPMPRWCLLGFWTLIRPSHHSAWSRRRYWRNRSLIDWLMDRYFIGAAAPLHFSDFWNVEFLDHFSHTVDSAF